MWSSGLVNGLISLGVPCPSGTAPNSPVNSKPMASWPAFPSRPSAESCSPTSSNRGALTCGSPPGCLVISALPSRSRPWSNSTPARLPGGSESCVSMRRRICNHVLVWPRRNRHCQDSQRAWSMNGIVNLMEMAEFAPPFLMRRARLRRRSSTILRETHQRKNHEVDNTLFLWGCTQQCVGIAANDSSRYRGQFGAEALVGKVDIS